jgi:hypothetical protein
MKGFGVSIFILIGLSLNPSVFGQAKETLPPQIYQGRADKAQKDLGGLDGGRIIQPPKTEENYEFFKGYRDKKRKENAERESEAIANVEEINKRFTPPPEYLNKYSEYTGGKNLGIFRFFPDINCGQGKTADVAELERCGHLPQVAGFGSKMSFRLKEFPISMASRIDFFFNLSDIHFVGNNFVAGNDSVESLITEIGTVDLKNIKSNSKGINFLANWKKSKNKADFVSHQRIIEKGITNGGYQYSSKVPIKLNAAYALRSIAYYQKHKSFYSSDILIVFKVVGQEKDGSVIIIWKQLSKNDDTFIGT